MDLHRGVRVRKSPYFRHGPVVQRPSIRPCQGRDRRFESGRDRSVKPEDAATADQTARTVDLIMGAKAPVASIGAARSFTGSTDSPS